MTNQTKPVSCDLIQAIETLVEEEGAEEVVDFMESYGVSPTRQTGELSREVEDYFE